MSFQYPLQKVVDLKNNERTQAEWMLSIALGKLKVEESTLHGLRKQREVLAQSLSQASLNCATISDLQCYQEYLSYIEECISFKEQEVMDAKRHVTTKQSDLMDKMKDEKVWNKAREKAYEQFQAMTLKKEQAVLDELTTSRHLII